MKKVTFLFLAVFLFSFFSFSQSSLLDKIPVEEEEEDKRVVDVFGGLRIINQQSTEMMTKRSLNVLIQHRFGSLNNGIGQLFGLDQANIRLGVSYGISDNVMIGLGRDKVNAAWDGLFKWKILDQDNHIPISLAYSGSIAITTLSDTLYTNNFNRRLSYSHQLLVSRKFKDLISVQLAAGVVHRNYVVSNDYNNLVFHLGLAVRAKISKSFYLLGDYVQTLNSVNSSLNPAIGIGGEFVTGGGHSFQLHFTNAQGMHENSYIRGTNSSFFSNEIRFGFNISRVFYL